MSLEENINSYDPESLSHLTKEVSFSQLSHNA